MTIAILIYSMLGGGAERVVSYLLPYLKEQGHIVHLVVMNDRRSYDIPTDIPVHFLEMSNANGTGFLKFFNQPYLTIK